MDQDVLGIPLNDPEKRCVQPRIRSDEANVGNGLRGGIAQPHRRNVAGLNVRRAVALVKEVRKEFVEQRLRVDRTDTRL
jgi:hypothetical protein